MRKIKIRRLSNLPNKFNSFAYAVESGFPEGVSGLYETTNGNVIYSPVRVGEHNRSFNCEYTVRERDGVKYLSLVNPMAELAGNFGAVANLATKGGFAENAVLMKMFAEMSLQNQAIQTKAVPAEETETEETEAEESAPVVEEAAPAAAPAKKKK